MLAKALKDHGVEVLSTGGTYRALEAEGVKAIKVSDFTGAPEILDGRVKTLHPKIHGGILALPTSEHQQTLAEQGMEPIDLVVVNLYPFKETIAKPDTDFDTAIENIDIGGPTMIRSAAKNWQRVTAIVDPGDYEELARVLRENEGGLPMDFRRAMQRKAFAHTAGYDAAIANYLLRFSDEGQRVDDSRLEDSFFMAAEHGESLRYGENPHQAARFYACDHARQEPSGFDQAVLHQGKALSYNNLLDADAALGLIRDLKVCGHAAAVFKHLSPCGAAVAVGSESLADVYVKARQADAESAFGGIVALTGVVDEAVAERIAETFIEVVIAPAYSAAALDILSKKKNLRLLEIPNMFQETEIAAPLRIRSVAGGVLIQREDLISVNAMQAEVASALPPTEAQRLSMELGQRVCKAVRSNAIVLVKDGVTVGIGGGQTSRVEAVRQAIARAGELAKDSVLASDAFFPFRDNIDEAAAAGVAAVIQPGGSRRDEEVITAINEHEMAMLFTKERHFRH